MLLQRRDRLRAEEIREPLKQAADRLQAVLAGAAAAASASATDTAEPAGDLPDPFEQDLSPWLLRRLQLAVDIAGALHAEAGQVRRALEMGSDRV